MNLYLAAVGVILVVFVLPAWLAFRKEERVARAELDNLVGVDLHIDACRFGDKLVEVLLRIRVVVRPAHVTETELAIGAEVPARRDEFGSWRLILFWNVAPSEPLAVCQA